ncbi:MAG: LLM class flavin-dependent oxidoreductase [Candidatus Entotheonellia bacterium]
MESPLQLSVLDQSPVREGGTATDALQETIALAVATEAMGYRRFWVAEHHNVGNFAGTSPEILIGQIAARTRTIRVGSGGVMLTHYSALKVAENFRLLQSLYPGRIDLGIGRAPGSDSLTAAALAYPGMVRDVRHFPQQVADVWAYLSETLERSHPFAGVHAGPGQPAGSPDIWLLGSRVESAHLAAKMGLPFSYAHFFGTGVEDGPLIVESYRRHFQPSARFAQPHVNVGVHVLCAETAEEALRLASSRNLMKLRSALGMRAGVPSVEEALAYPYRPEELAYLEQVKRSYIDGDPQQVKAKLQDIADLYQTTDLTIVTICHGFAERVRSYELVAEVCELKSQRES